MKIESKFKLTAICVFAVMLFVAALPYKTNLATRDALNDLDQVLMREKQFESLLNLLRDAETGQRGFVITGKDSFLSPYYSALGQLPMLRRALIEQSRTSAEKKEVDTIFSISDLKMAELAETVALRRTDGFATVEPIVSSERGKKYMDTLRELIGRQTALSFQQRNAVRANLDSMSNNSLYTSLGATLANLSILTLLLILMLRLLTERKVAANQLQQTSNDLRASNADALLRNAQMEISAAMLQALDAVKTVPETSGIIATYCAKLFPKMSGTLYLHDKPRELLEPHALWGLRAAAAKAFELNECWALTRGGIHHARNAQDLRCAHYSNTVAALTECLCFPLVLQGEVIGLLSVESSPLENTASSHRYLLERTAEQIALAVSNVGLRETLHLQSIVDPLTGMFNRRYMDEALKRELFRAERKTAPLALIVFDLDHFKRVNDTYGHDAGDYVLKSVARQVTENIRDSDLACRFGGEELVLIMPECDIATAMQRAEKIRDAIASLDLHHIGSTLGTVSASFGVAQFPQHGRDATTLLHAADKAMYRAKQAGRNRVLAAQ